MAEIIITRKNGDKYTVLVDDADYASVVAAGPWFIVRGASRIDRWYVMRNIRDAKTERGAASRYLHALLAGTPPGAETDHISGDTLDNRRANLRVTTRKQNAENMRLHPRNTSGFRGVSWDKRAGKWYGRVTRRRRVIWLKYFDTLEDAARAVAAARSRLMTHNNEARHPAR